MDNIEQDIRELQFYLRELSAADERIRPVGIDGIYGDETREAVRNFQSINEMPVTGVVTPNDWNAIANAFLELSHKNSEHRRIKAIYDPRYVFVLGDSGDPVYFIQVMLSALSRRFVNIQRPPINGVFDERTLESAEVFLKINNTDSIDKDVFNSITDNYNNL